MSRYITRIDEKTVERGKVLANSLEQMTESDSISSFAFLKYLPEAVLNLSKFKVGDRVYLSRVPMIEAKSGWFPCKHYLIPGNPGIIRDRFVRLLDCSEDRGSEDIRCVFTYLVQFENDSWFSGFGDRNLMPTNEAAVFSLEEDILTSDSKDYEIKYNNDGIQIKSYTIGGCLTVMIKDKKSTDWEVIWDNGKSIPRVKEIEFKLCPTCGK
jgi:hypothetical protein